MALAQTTRAKVPIDCRNGTQGQQDPPVHGAQANVGIPGAAEVALGGSASMDHAAPCHCRVVTRR